mmetsp:Transcript_75803/g.152320  ORF Transcript_75803/g.152320 Transcript_75803/m.152320 type:complete len:245 (+) Transcript_75803:1847-2581(+)
MPGCLSLARARLSMFTSLLMFGCRRFFMRSTSAFWITLSAKTSLVVFFVARQIWVKFPTPSSSPIVKSLAVGFLGEEADAAAAASSDVGAKRALRSLENSEGRPFDLSAGTAASTTTPLSIDLAASAVRPKVSSAEAFLHHPFGQLGEIVVHSIASAKDAAWSPRAALHMLRFENNMQLSSLGEKEIASLYASKAPRRSFARSREFPNSFNALGSVGRASNDTSSILKIKVAFGGMRSRHPSSP